MHPFSHHGLFCTFFALLAANLFCVHATVSAESGQLEQQRGWESHGPITSLPGYSGKLPSKHYGGYISVGDKQLYYYMVESERSPATDPVVLWLNGGPGCSSFDGFIYEQGPFKYSLTDGGRSVKLTDNPFAWSKVATMVFLDSPSGVGLSFSFNTSDYKTKDTQVARDSHAVLRALFTRHPQLQKNDFYISGESYAGQYIPMLAREVVEGNAKGVKPFINIKGYLIGNGVTDDEFDGNAYMPFAAGMSLISKAQLQQAQQICDGSFWNATEGSRCEDVQNGLWEQMGDVNIYNILEDCHYEPNTSPSIMADRRQQIQQLRRSHPRWPLRPVLGRNQPDAPEVHNWATLLGSSDPPCVLSREADLWLNDEAVRKALHAAPKDLAGPWQLCSRRIKYKSDGGSMLPIHDMLVRKHGLRALIFSGVHDMAVPHTGTEMWTAAMARANAGVDATECLHADSGTNTKLALKCQGIKSPWAPWYNSESPAQVAGYVVVYNSGLTYATITGAGHMVPQTKPREALDMFSRFLAGKHLAADRNQGQQL